MVEQWTPVKNILREKKGKQRVAKKKREREKLQKPPCIQKYIDIDWHSDTVQE